LDNIPDVNKVLIQKNDYQFGEYIILRMKKILPSIMVLVSAYLTADYTSLILEGDDRLVRKMALGAWAVQLIVWVILLIKAFKKGEEVSK